MKAKSELIERHLKALKGIEHKTVEAGWFESDRYPAAKGKSVGIPVAAVARIQEFGATIERDGHKIVIPARPFMRKAWSDFNQRRVEVQVKLAKKVVAGEITQEQALAQIGDFLVATIVRSIRNGGWEKNAPSTVKKKGFDKPLIDSAHMWKTVNSKIV